MRLGGARPGLRAPPWPSGGRGEENVLVWRNQSARAERWEHRLDRRWELDAKTKAVMTLLLVRGPHHHRHPRAGSGLSHPGHPGGGIAAPVA